VRMEVTQARQQQQCAYHVQATHQLWVLEQFFPMNAPVLQTSTVSPVATVLTVPQASAVQRAVTRVYFEVLLIQDSRGLRARILTSFQDFGLPKQIHYPYSSAMIWTRARVVHLSLALLTWLTLPVAYVQRDISDKARFANAALPRMNQLSTTQQCLFL